MAVRLPQHHGSRSDREHAGPHLDGPGPGPQDDQALDPERPRRRRVDRGHVVDLARRRHPVAHPDRRCGPRRALAGQVVERGSRHREGDRAVRIGRFPGRPSAPRPSRSDHRSDGRGGRGRGAAFGAGARRGGGRRRRAVEVRADPRQRRSRAGRHDGDNQLLPAIGERWSPPFPAARGRAGATGGEPRLRGSCPGGNAGRRHLRTGARHDRRALAGNGHRGCNASADRAAIRGGRPPGRVPHLESARRAPTPSPSACRDSVPSSGTRWSSVPAARPEWMRI